MSIYANYDKNAPSIGDSGLLHGQIGINQNDKHGSRIDNMIYSGDLIQLMCCNNSILTYYGNDLLMLPYQEQNEKKNLLTKLRLISEDHNSNQRLLSPIIYGQNVYIEFNVLGEAESKLIGYDQKLKVLGNNQSNLFKIYNSSNLSSQGVIRIGDQIIIARTGCPANQNNIYLTVNSDSSIRTDGFQNEATQFVIQANIGCGPNWIHDQDTRSLGGQQLTEIEHQRLVMDQRGILTDRLKQLQNNFSVEEKQLNDQCQEKILRETAVNDQLKKLLSQFTGQ